MLSRALTQRNSSFFFNPRQAPSQAQGLAAGNRFRDKTLNRCFCFRRDFCLRVCCISVGLVQSVSWIRRGKWGNPAHRSTADCGGTVPYSTELAAVDRPDTGWRTGQFLPHPPNETLAQRRPARHERYSGGPGTDMGQPPPPAQRPTAHGNCIQRDIERARDSTVTSHCAMKTTESRHL